MPTTSPGLRPQFVIHAAAYTDVDGSESNYELAMSINDAGSRNVAIACREIGAGMIYYSTDYVFAGEKVSPYLESDTPDPKTVYGQSKLAGEEAVTEMLENFAIVRIAWLYGRHGWNFVRTMLKLGRQQVEAGRSGKEVTPLKVVDDQVGNPTWTVEVVRQTAEIMKHHLRGVFHATSEGETSWYGFARDIFSLMGMPVTLVPCTTEQMPRPAPRPARSSLENARLKAAGRNLMRPYNDALAEFLELYGRELMV